MESGPGPEHDAFTKWAESNGIKIRGVAPAHFVGRRLGMVATRDIDEGETLLSIPVSVMLTPDSIPESFVSLFPEGVSTHALLAAYLTHGDTTSGPLKDINVWRAVWPSWEEFEQSLPIFWPGEVQVLDLDSLALANSLERSYATVGREYDDDEIAGPGMDLLPPSISNRWTSLPKSASNKNRSKSQPYETRYQNLLSQQYERLRNHWKAVVSVFPSTAWTVFARNWAVVNSRSFYYVSPGKKEPEDWNDAIALVPYADYFNHDDDDAGCEVKFDGREYTFKAARSYDKGEEIFMSYGSHSNDFLLVEYGFYLEDNPSDVVFLDDVIIPELNASEKKALAENDCFGNFEINSAGLLDSILHAACIKFMSRPDWQNLVNAVLEDGYDKGKVVDTVRPWIEAYLREVTVRSESLIRLLKTSLSESAREKVDMMLNRWKQIGGLCESAMSAISE